MKKYFILLAIAIILSFPLILAEESISQSSFTIEIYNQTIHISSSEYSGNNQQFNFTIMNTTGVTSVNGTNVTTQIFYVPDTTYNFSFLYVNNITVPMDLVDKYTYCLDNLSQCQLNSANNISSLNLEMQKKEDDKTNLQSQIDKFNQQQKDTQNRWFIVGIIAFVLGILAMGTFTGYFGKKFKNKKEEFFNRRTGA